MKVRDRVRELRRVKASELIPNPKNWRIHPTEQADALRGVLAEIGYADALLARETDEGLMIIDGHLRAETTPDSEVPVLVLDVDEAEADKMLLTLDPLAGMAEMDGEAVDKLLESVVTESESVQALLDEMGEEARKLRPDGAGGDDFNVEEALESENACKVERGQVWVCGDHRVMCGDSTEAEDVARLMAGEKANLMVTDPPYGIEYLEGFEDPLFAKAAKRRTDGKRVSGDTPDLDLETAFRLTMETLRPGSGWYVCCPSGERQTVFRNLLQPWNLKQELIWVKQVFVFGRSDYQWQHESLLYGWRTGGSASLVWWPE